MAKVTKAEFGSLAGVSRAAVYKALKAGKIIECEMGRIDTEDPTNTAYMYYNQGRGKGTAKKPKADTPGGNGMWPVVSVPAGPAAGYDILGVREKKDLADIRMKNAAADRHLIAKAERLGLLILRSEVGQMMQVLGAEIRTRFLDMPRRIAPQIAAMVEAGQGDREIEKLLDTEITDAIRHAKEAARRAGLGDL